MILFLEDDNRLYVDLRDGTRNQFEQENGNNFKSTM